MDGSGPTRWMRQVVGVLVMIKFFNLAFDPETHKPIEVEAADGYYAHAADVIELAEAYTVLCKAAENMVTAIREENGREE